jgi:ATP-dependent RNA helicase SUPV3L1/SUV3
MDRRPKPPEPAPPLAEQQALAAASADDATGQHEGATPDAAAIGDPLSSDTSAVAAEPPDSPVENPAPPTEPTDAAPASTAIPEVPPEAAPTFADEALPEPGVEPTTAEAASKAEALAAPVGGTTAVDGSRVAAEEPALIEVWRPGRAEGRRPRFKPRRGRAETADATPLASDSKARPASAEAGSAPASAAHAATDANPPEERHGRHRRKGGQDRRFEHPRRDRERAPPHAARRERREPAPDPNSPFAKLAALKARLEAEAKERR